MLPLMVVKSPRCDEMVTLPAGLTPESRVRCPFSKEEFQVQEILDQLPPMLEVVDGPAAALADTSSAASAGAMAATMVDDTSRDTAAGDGFGFLDTAEKPDTPERGDDTPKGPALFEPEAGSKQPSASSFDFAAADAAEDVANGDGTAAAPSRRKARPRGRKKPKNAAAEVVKIVLGGIAGLIIAQMIMWWGMKRDPFNLAPKLPSWLPVAPAALRDPSTEQQEPVNGGETADDGTGQNGQNGPNVEPEVAFENDPGRGFDAPGSGDQAPDVIDDTDHNAAPEAADNGGDDSALTAVVGDDAASTPPDDPPLDTPAEELLGVRSAPFYTGDELGEVLIASHEAMTGVDPKVGLEMTTKEKKEAAAALYKLLCTLSERATFVDPNGSQVEERLAAIDGILLELGKKKSNLDLFGVFGGFLIGREEPPADKGVVLPGTVRSIAPLGKLFDTELQLSGGEQPVVTIMSKNDPNDAFNVGDRVIILGYIVDDPSIRLAGYEGNLPRVVWGGYPVVLPKAEKKGPTRPRGGGN